MQEFTVNVVHCGGINFSLPYYTQKKKKKNLRLCHVTVTKPPPQFHLMIIWTLFSFCLPFYLTLPHYFCHFPG